MLLQVTHSGSFVVAETGENVERLVWSFAVFEVTFLEVVLPGSGHATLADEDAVLPFLVADGR
jgi:hypothetical protein